MTQNYPEQFHTWPEMMTSGDIAEALAVSRQTAIRIMKKEGFPLLNPEHRRNMRVNKYRFLDWLRTGN